MRSVQRYPERTGRETVVSLPDLLFPYGVRINDVRRRHRLLCYGQRAFHTIVVMETAKVRNVAGDVADFQGKRFRTWRVGINETRIVNPLCRQRLVGVARQRDFRVKHQQGWSVGLRFRQYRLEVRLSVRESDGVGRNVRLGEYPHNGIAGMNR